jgi:hypothetical protein
MSFRDGSTGIFLGRVVLDPERTHSSDLVDVPVSIQSNGWVTVWDGNDPERPVCHWPPQSVIAVVPSAQTGDDA